MAYTTINKSTDYFNTKIYTGNQSSTHAVTGVGFEPSLTWLKIRTGAGSHYLYDATRSVTKSISSDTTSAELTNSYFSSFNTDGFTLGSASNNVNGAYNYASWNWKANGAGSANTAGSINSTVSVNTTSGFSISSYTGTGSLATVGHGLGVAPAMIIMKNRSTTNGWEVYHQSLGNTRYMQLHSTSVGGTSATRWNNTSPTSTVFTVNTEGGVNSSGGNLIAYCFAEKQGYSKFGSYVGNGNADGSFIYTGFKPAFVIYKGASGTGTTDNWEMIDNKRTDGTLGNPKNEVLYPNLSNAEGVNTTDRLDLLSNGFKMRTGSSDYNASGSTYIYMAFAEAPLVGTNNVPCTAR